MFEAILWTGTLFYPTELIGPESTTPFYNLIIQFFNFNKVHLIVLAFLLTYFNALFLNYIVIEFGLLPRNTLLSAFAFILLISYSPSSTNFYPALPAISFLLLSLINFFKTYSLKEPYYLIFNASFFIGIASLFYLPLIFFIIWLWFSLIVNRIYLWREWSITIIGAIVPYLFLAVYYFWNDEIFNTSIVYYSFFTEIKPLLFSNNIFDYIIWIYAIILIIFSVGRLFSAFKERNIQFRKNSMILIFFFLISLIPLLYSGKNFIANNSFTIIPLSVFLSYYFSVLKNINRMGIAILILIILIVFNNYFSMIYFK
ncbi:MAG: hypothetical protein JEY97_11045 [Bacteroidales bacterium]|nr:hypothetical protein [Bacteroidales bacterium]